MNAFSKITTTLVASAALAITFSCSSGGGGGGEPPDDGISSSVITTGGSSSSINISSSSDGVLGSSSSDVVAGTSSSSVTGDVGKNALITEIATAETAKESAEVSVDGSDVNPTDFWVTQAAMTALENAITTAEGVKDDGSVTQAQVDAAKATLQAAITTFNTAKKAGTQASAEAKTALGTKITEATTAKTGVSVSTNGEDIEPSKYWATQSAITTLETAIATAQAVKDKANATQTEVTNATTTLNTAITAFTKQLGAEITTAKADLTAKIAEANSAKTGVETANTFPDEFWVTPAEMTALETAISTATTANTTATTKKGFDDATAALNTAISTFNAAKQAGTVPLCGGSKYTIATEFCDVSTVRTKCGGATYTSATQFCYNSSKVGNYCGNRTDEYNPDIYECKPGINPNGIYLKSKIIDTRNGTQEYEAVLIGTQTWMAKNLNYNADGSRCYGDNTGGDSQNRCNTYGRLYNWATAMAGAVSSTANPSGVQGVCPSGWHLPSGMEWQALMNFVDGTSLTSPATSTYAGEKLKATSGWNSNGNGTDDFGFAALPGGNVGSDGNFINVGINGYWWSASENNANNAYSRLMYYNYEDALWGYYDKTYLRSVRCVRD